ncbi:energy transducer TonB family protein [Sphingobium cloacae]|uniref:energy transducer TonB family protein n=1 Tax=Sphingobium cloacae TaxID=120107 RepID=UPI001E404D90|nr:energy transducer TonB [Sphingobium cloacae]
MNEKREQEVEVVDPGPPVPETTAPKSIAAPAASRASNDAQPNWEGQILAHLERFRRYPARARAARQEGTAFLRFTMNREGQVLSATIFKKSGSFDLDRAALDTLQRAQPLPPIPAGRPDVVELTIPVEFYLRR